MVASFITRRRLTGFIRDNNWTTHAAVLRLSSLSHTNIEYGAAQCANARNAQCRAMRATRLAASAPRRQLQILKRPFVIGRDRDNDAVGLQLQIGAWNEILDGEHGVRSQLSASRTQTVRQGTGCVSRGWAGAPRTPSRPARRCRRR